ncbi:hypothetical protein Poly41_67060 [Novipirellula artificiosorum]|uniref:Uncharacterized protein n=1 Tax=Novipirellula artificiosorum TaxID=2528016 RepID=A0A5C6CZZ4_9BACT|nr:hypothetical protein Poly41_67060 [Novipirellula artificiosorum]
MFYCTEGFRTFFVFFGAQSTAKGGIVRLMPFVVYSRPDDSSVGCVNRGVVSIEIVWRAAASVPRFIGPGRCDALRGRIDRFGCDPAVFACARPPATCCDAVGVSGSWLCGCGCSLPELPLVVPAYGNAFGVSDSWLLFGAGTAVGCSSLRECFRRQGLVVGCSVAVAWCRNSRWSFLRTAMLLELGTRGRTAALRGRFTVYRRLAPCRS